MAGEVGHDLEMDQQGLVSQDPPAAPVGALAVGELRSGERGHHWTERIGHGVDCPSAAPGGACLVVAGGPAWTGSVEELVESASQRCEATVRASGRRHQLGWVGCRGEKPAQLA
jgi:hypothetical protein